MEIKQLRANVGNCGPARNAQAIKYIVIHYTGNDGDTAMNNAKYYASTVVKSSAHYFVDNKEIVQLFLMLQSEDKRDTPLTWFAPS